MLARYQGFIADSARWKGFDLRPGDVVITTPGKCGTTWLQNIVGMLLLGRVDLGRPLSELSPWLDMQIRPLDEVRASLAAQQHRRFLKTHTPLDGLPWSDDVTYIAAVRHPLQVALSSLDHFHNIDGSQTHALRSEHAIGDFDWEAEPDEGPAEPGEYLRWWIAHEAPHRGTGLESLAAFSDQVRQYWEARGRPNLHLFHFDDLLTDLDGQVRRLAEILEVDHSPETIADMVEAATFTSMRSRAEHLAPDAELGVWRSANRFFRSGGRRDWSRLLATEEIAAFEDRFRSLVGAAAAGWVLDPDHAHRRRPT